MTIFRKSQIRNSNASPNPQRRVTFAEPLPPTQSVINAAKALIDLKNSTQLIKMAKYSDLCDKPLIALSLSKHNNLKVRRALAGNKNLYRMPEEVTIRLSLDKDVFVRCELAENINLHKSPQDVSERLSRDAHKWVRNALERNKNYHEVFKSGFTMF